MGCSANDLMLALSTRKVQTGKDKVVKSLTMQQVRYSVVWALHQIRYFCSFDFGTPTFSFKNHNGMVLTLIQAIDTRDAMAKFIYANLFDWIVDKINRSLAMDKEKTGRRINILDIYGFESFEVN